MEKQFYAYKSATAWLRSQGYKRINKANYLRAAGGTLATILMQVMGRPYTVYFT